VSSFTRPADLRMLGNYRWADEVFLEAMTVLGVARWRRTVMYWAVRVFGRGNYKR